MRTHTPVGAPGSGPAVSTPVVMLNDPTAGNAPNPGTPPAPAKQKMKKSEAIALAASLISKATGKPEADVRAAFVEMQSEPTPAPVQTLQNIDPEAGKLAALEKKYASYTQLAALTGLDDSFVQLCKVNDWDFETARKESLKALAEKAKPVTGLSVQVGADQNLVSLRSAMSDGIRLRCGTKVEKPHARADEFRGLSFDRLARVYLGNIGYSSDEVLRMGQGKLFDIVLNPRRMPSRNVQLAESVGDFSSILVDAINKTLLQAYRDAAPTWQLWARRATAPDFKTINRVKISEVATPVERVPGMTVTYTDIKDSKETYVLKEYASALRITRRALINDDKDAFSRIPMSQGAACSRLEEDLAYQAFTSNPTMGEDSTALFHANHKNYVASGSGAAPSATTLSAGFAAMKKQTGLLGAAKLELTPKFIITSPDLEWSVQQLLASSTLIATVSTTSSAPATIGSQNVFQNKLAVIGSTRVATAANWYLLASYADAKVDTVEVSFLEDEPEPVLKQETDFDTDDQKFFVRHTCAAQVLDFRGLYFNYGS